MAASANTSSQKLEGDLLSIVLPGFEHVQCLRRSLALRATEVLRKRKDLMQPKELAFVECSHASSSHGFRISTEESHAIVYTDLHLPALARTTIVVALEVGRAFARHFEWFLGCLGTLRCCICELMFSKSFTKIVMAVSSVGLVKVVEICWWDLIESSALVLPEAQRIDCRNAVPDLDGCTKVQVPSNAVIGL